MTARSGAMPMMPTRRHAASLGHRNTLSQRRSHPPLQERVYRALLKLPADGKIIKHPPTGRTVTWSAARGFDDEEIDRLEDAFSSPLQHLRTRNPATAKRISLMTANPSNNGDAALDDVHVDRGQDSADATRTYAHGAHLCAERASVAAESAHGSAMSAYDAAHSSHDAAMSAFDVVDSARDSTDLAERWSNNSRGWAANSAMVYHIVLGIRLGTLFGVVLALVIYVTVNRIIDERQLPNDSHPNALVTEWVVPQLRPDMPTAITAGRAKAHM